MFLETIRSPGLAHLAYLVGDGDEAIAIDPPRDVERVLAAARAHGARVTHVLETHRNEDLVVGSPELAARTGATIHHGAALDFGYGVATEEGALFGAGDVVLSALETPGHTPESLSFVLRDRSTGQSPLAVFTGDALFVGEVGRTDLAGDEEEAAAALYASLHDKLLPLGDHVMIHPAHGAGSVCGEGMADRDVSTLGYERRHSPALQLDRAAFIARKKAERHVVPPYFREMEKLNLAGPPVLHHLPEAPALGLEAFDEAARSGARIVDVRSAKAHVGAAIPEALALPLSVLSAYAGWLLDPDRPVLLVAEDRAQVDEAVQRLARLGRTRVAGHLAGGMPTWETAGRPLRRLGLATVEDLRAQLEEAPGQILDVRKASEHDDARLPGSTHAFLGELPKKLGDGTLPKGRLVAFCGSGQRATVAASLLAAEGREVAVALGSMAAWQAKGHPTR